MQLKIPSKWLAGAALIFGILGIGLWSMAILSSAPYLPDQGTVTDSTPIPPISSSQHPPGLVAGAEIEPTDSTSTAAPVDSTPSPHLKIPSINVNAVVESVGLTSEGAMDVPIGPTNAAWYNKSVLPGEVGSAVIDGHSGKWKNGVVGVFDNLNKLQTGDKIYFEDAAGITTTFVVRELRSYDQAADGSEVFGSSDGQAHLNLITCEGVWNETLKSYSNRLVVFADKEIE